MLTGFLNARARNGERQKNSWSYAITLAMFAKRTEGPMGCVRAAQREIYPSVAAFHNESASCKKKATGWKVRPHTKKVSFGVGVV
jgi:hypothetical protein